MSLFGGGGRIGIRFEYLHIRIPALRLSQPFFDPVRDAVIVGVVFSGVRLSSVDTTVSVDVFSGLSGRPSPSESEPGEKHTMDEMYSGSVGRMLVFETAASES